MLPQGFEKENNILRLVHLCIDSTLNNLQINTNFLYLVSSYLSWLTELLGVKLQRIIIHSYAVKNCLLQILLNKKVICFKF